MFNLDAIKKRRASIDLENFEEFIIHAPADIDALIAQTEILNKMRTLWQKLLTTPHNHGKLIRIDCPRCILLEEIDVLLNPAMAEYYNSLTLACGHPRSELDVMIDAWAGCTGGKIKTNYCRACENESHR